VLVGVDVGVDALVGTKVAVGARVGVFVGAIVKVGTDVQVAVGARVDGAEVLHAVTARQPTAKKNDNKYDLFCRDDTLYHSK